MSTLDRVRERACAYRSAVSMGPPPHASLAEVLRSRLRPSTSNHSMARATLASIASAVRAGWKWDRSELATMRTSSRLPIAWLSAPASSRQTSRSCRPMISGQSLNAGSTTWRKGSWISSACSESWGAVLFVKTPEEAASFPQSSLSTSSAPRGVSKAPDPHTETAGK